MMREKLKSSVNRRLVLYAVFAVAMAYLETAVVVYLRLLYYPEGFSFPMKMIPPRVALIELGREAATLIMLWYVAKITADRFKEKFALFVYTFGIWDIFYYLWLKVLINWPVSWTEWDILFLIPLPWIAPWLAPVLVSIGLIVGAVAVFHYPQRFTEKIFNPKEWLGMITSAALILASFFTETPEILRQGVPDDYSWWLFFIGYGMGWLIFANRWMRGEQLTP